MNGIKLEYNYLFLMKIKAVKPKMRKNVASSDHYCVSLRVTCVGINHLGKVTNCSCCYIICKVLDVYPPARISLDIRMIAITSLSPDIHRLVSCLRFAVVEKHV
jgi:hypothetical protein